LLILSLLFTGSLVNWVTYPYKIAKSQLYVNTKIYVSCPANITTGGPELLHQLVYHLRKDLNINAFMYYYDYFDKNISSPVHSDYKIYNNPYIIKSDEIEDNDKNIFIAPEIISEKGCLYENLNC